MAEKTCILCGGPLQLGCDGVCMICLRRQGDEYARTGDIRVLFGRTYHSSPDAMYCNRCAAPLTEEARGQQKQKASRILDHMDQDPRLAIIDQKLEEFRQSLIAEMDPSGRT